jgi:hypothetical protein
MASSTAGIERMAIGFRMRPITLSARKSRLLMWSRWVWLMKTSVILLCASTVNADVIVPASSITRSFTRKPGGLCPMPSEPEHPRTLSFIEPP